MFSYCHVLDSHFSVMFLAGEAVVQLPCLRVYDGPMNKLTCIKDNEVACVLFLDSFFALYFTLDTSEYNCLGFGERKYELVCSHETNLETCLLNSTKFMWMK